MNQLEKYKTALLAFLESRIVPPPEGYNFIIYDLISDDRRETIEAIKIFPVPESTAADLLEELANAAELYIIKKNQERAAKSKPGPTESYKMGAYLAERIGYVYDPLRETWTNPNK